MTLANEVCKALKLKDVEYKFTGGIDGGRGWKGDVKKMRLDIKQLKSHGWDPQYTSRKAINETAKWLDEIIKFDSEDQISSCSVVRPSLASRAEHPGSNPGGSTKFNSMKYAVFLF